METLSLPPELQRAIEIADKIPPLTPRGWVEAALGGLQDVDEASRRGIEAAEKEGIPGFSKNEFEIGGMTIRVDTYLSENGHIGILEDAKGSLFGEDQPLEQAYGEEYRAKVAEIVREQQNAVKDAGGPNAVQKQLDEFIKDRFQELSAAPSEPQNTQTANINAPLPSPPSQAGDISFG